MPEVSRLPVEFVYEPWKAPLEVQRKSGCVVGRDYPERVVMHEEAAAENAEKMRELRKKILRELRQVGAVCMPNRYWRR